ncbi:hypothetical protein, partial [Gryllotalpicola sp.]|uniref:hypothetical protein n=1 Tax=Gryllotalpicola sp. TaxID=1932787 RepID=UPI00260E2584
LFSSNWAAVFNLYYFLGFPLAAGTAVWFFRTIRLPGAVSIAMAMLFALSPIHFIRNDLHIFLGEYWTIPLGLLVAARIALGLPVFTKPGPEGSRARLSPLRTTVTVVLLGLMGASWAYYAIYGAGILALAGIYRAIAARRWRPLLPAAVSAAVGLGAFVLSALPDLAYGWQHGANPWALTRTANAADINSLKLTELLLPTPGDRIPFLSQLRAFYDTTYITLGSNAYEHVALGLVGAVGVIATIVIVVFAPIRQLRGGRGLARDGSELQRALGVIVAFNVAAFLVGTMGGLSAIISFFTPVLQAPNRIAIFIQLFSLGITGILLTWLWHRISAAWMPFIARVFRRALRPRVLAAIGTVLAFGVVAFGVWDQAVPTANQQIDYTADSAKFAADKAWTRSMVAVLPKGAKVVEYPYIAVPEGRPENGAVDAYDQLIPSLFTDQVQWSAGAVKGRARADWVDIATRTMGPRALACVATMAGFNAVLLDKNALLPTNVPFAEGQFQKVLGAKKDSASTDRYAFYLTDALRKKFAKLDARKVAAAGNGAVNPVEVHWLPGYTETHTPGYNQVVGSFSVSDALRPYQPEFVVENPLDVPRKVQIQFSGRYTGKGGGAVAFTGSDGTTHDFTLEESDKAFGLTVVVPPGTSTIRAALVSGDDWPSRNGFDGGPLQIGSVQALDESLANFLTTNAPECLGPVANPGS